MADVSVSPPVAESLFAEPFGCDPAQLITEAKSVEFSDWETLQKDITTDAKNVLVVCLGALWSYPSYASLLHFQAHTAEEKNEGVKFYAIDEEGSEERKFCSNNGILVGNTALVIWYRGRQLTFERQLWGQVDKITGPFNRQKLKSLLETLTKEAVMSGQPIKVPF